MSDARLAQWTLSMAPAGTGRFAVIATSATPVANATLGRFDPTVLANGLYDVQLRAVDASGRETIDQVTYEVIENLKLGQFTVSFLDHHLTA